MVKRWGARNHSRQIKDRARILLFISLSHRDAFALPVVMIASVVMMMVLVSGLSATTSVNSGLRQRHAALMQKTASDAGLAMATYCIEANNNSITWTDTKPLKPNTDCNGDEQFSCSGASPSSNCFVTVSGNAKTSFSDGVSLDGTGTASDINSQGIVINYRGSGGSAQSVESSNSASKTKISGRDGSLYTTIAVGSSHTCAIASNGYTYCWGDNGYGRLGLGTSSDSYTPMQMAQGAIPSGARLKSVVAGSHHSCGIATDDRAYCWGITAMVT